MFTRSTQCIRGVLDPPVSVFILSLHRHPFLYTLFSSRFTLIINNNKKMCLKFLNLQDWSFYVCISGKRSGGEGLRQRPHIPVPVVSPLVSSHGPDSRRRTLSRICDSVHSVFICRRSLNCNVRLNVKTEGSKRLGYTGLGDPYYEWIIGVYYDSIRNR